MSLTGRPMFEVSRNNLVSRKWMFEGLSPSEAEGLREIIPLVFYSSFELECPTLDGSMSRTLSRLKRSTASKLPDLVEKTWLSAQYMLLNIARPFIFK